MFTKRFYKLLGIVIRTSTFFGGTPFIWDKKLKRIYTTKRSRVWFYLNSMAMFSAAGYTGLRALWIQWFGNVSDLGFPLALCLAALFDSCMYIVIIIDPEYVGAVFNAGISYWNNFCRNWKPGFKPKSSFLNVLLDWYMFCAVMLIYLSPYPISAHLLFFPGNPAYPCSFLEFMCNTWLHLFAVCSYFWLLHSCFCSIIFFFAFAIIFYVYIICTTLTKEFSASNFKPLKYSTSDRLRQPETLQFEYRRMEILSKNLNGVCAPVIIPLQSITSNFALSCNYLLIQSYEDLSTVTILILLFWSSGACVIMCVILFVGGFIHLHGKKALGTWRYYDWPRREKKLLSKFRKGCRPIAIRVGGYYTIRRLSVLKYIRGIIRGTFRALLIST